MDRGDEFNVYLYSRFNTSEYGYNTSNKFTNSIRPSIKLNGEYEVALKNIIYDPDLKAIRKGDSEYEIRLNVSYGNGEHNVGQHGFTVRYTPQIDMVATNVIYLIRELDKDFVSFLITQDMIPVRDPPMRIFRYEFNRKFVSFTAIPYKLKPGFTDFRIHWEIGYGIAKLLGVESTSFVREPRFVALPQFPRRPDLLHIYCDIVVPSILGNQEVHLLDVIPMKHMAQKNGSITMYKRVNNLIIDDISIKITDENGELAKFTEDVSVFLILEFRKVAT